MFNSSLSINWDQQIKKEKNIMQTTALAVALSCTGLVIGDALVAIVIVVLTMLM